MGGFHENSAQACVIASCFPLLSAAQWTQQGNKRRPIPLQLYQTLPSDGFGALIGGGNDFVVADKLFLSPSLTYFYGNLGSIFLNDTRDLQVRKALNLLELNVGLMFRPRDI